ncbi:hypothetical protein [Brachybacterium hainanense]|uniref:Phage tail protein n=1 Tax=Brachybacterium hainanense TaxID=1541174 RepID=A0ABV6RFE1_9MICO
MKPGERRTFTWLPESPTKAFDCIIALDGEADPRSFVVTALALDADGVEVPPTSRRWVYSDHFTGYFQYGPLDEPQSTIRLRTWTSDAYVAEIRIEVIAWLKSAPSIPGIRALAVAPSDSSPVDSRTWNVLPTTEGAAA